MVASSGGKTETQPGLCGEGPYRVKNPISRPTLSGNDGLEREHPLPEGNKAGIPAPALLFLAFGDQGFGGVMRSRQR